jgi:hypothetical protein
MGDVEDPELYAAQPLYEWQQTEQGQVGYGACCRNTIYYRPDNQHLWS